LEAFSLGDAGEPPSLFCAACRETKKTCRKCGDSKSITQFTKRSDEHGMCKNCHAVAREGLFADGRARDDAAWRRKYGTERPAGTSRYDQDPAEALTGPNRRRRKRFKLAKREPIDRQAIFERDHWLCGICGKRVTREDAALDHIIPVSLGGADTPDNVRLAHGSCNSRRGDGIRHPGSTTRVHVD
jgi:hypothetical protein